MDLQRLKIDRGRPARGGAGAQPEAPRRGGRPGRGPGGVIALGALLALAGGAIYVFAPSLIATLDRFRLPVVRVVTVERAHPAEVGAVRGIAANGYVVAARRAALSADTPGRIVELLVKEGSVVRENEVVARLFADEYAAAAARAEADLAVAAAAHTRALAAQAAAEADVLQLEASLAAAEEALVGAEAERDLARRERTRAEQLARTGVSTGRELDETEMAVIRAGAGVDQAAALVNAARQTVEAGRARAKIAAADVAVAAAQEDAARATRDQAKATLQKTEVRAPFGGIVVLKDAEVGEVVSPNVTGGSTARGSVVTMVDFASLEVQCDVPETSIAQVRRDGRALVFLDAWPDRPYAARVSRIWPTANRTKATIEVRVAFDRPDERLRPEMGVRVVFAPEGEGEAEAAAAPAPAGATPATPAAPATPAGPPPLVIPAECRIREGGRAGVFVVERDVARFREVRFGAARGGQVAVDGGLEPGETVIIAPPARLASGDRIRVEGSP